MGILKTVELADFAEKKYQQNKCILKTVESADFAEKNTKRMGILKNKSLNVVVRWSELKPLQYNVLSLCQTQEKRFCKVSLLFFQMFLKTFSFTKQCSLRSFKICQLQEQKVSEASDPYRFQKSPNEYIKDLSDFY